MATDKQIREYIEAQRQAYQDSYEYRVPNKYERYFSNSVQSQLGYNRYLQAPTVDAETLIKKCFEAQLDDEDREYITVHVYKQIGNHGTEYLVQLVDLNGEAVETFVIEA